MPEQVIKYTPIGGTHDWGRGKWFWCLDPATRLRPPFAEFMLENNFVCVRPDHPLWSHGLGGIMPGGQSRIWRFGGEVVTANWIEEHLPRVRDRNIISVSHGGAVAFYAAAAGIKLNSLTTICMPIRKDMQSVYDAALPNITTYTNVYSDSWWRDRWQILGTLRDGSFRFRRTMEGQVNIGIKGVGHTHLVRTSRMKLLKSEGVLKRIRGDL